MHAGGKGEENSEGVEMVETAVDSLAGAIRNIHNAEDVVGLIV